MLDIKLVRENPQRVKDAMRSRNKDMDAVVDELLALDVQRREAIAQSEALKAEQNQINKQIPALKKQGEDVSALLAKMKDASAESKRLSALVTELEQKQRDLLLTIPNIPHESVPVGKDDSDNVELRKNGTPPTFDFEPKPHWDIGKELGILDPDTAAKVTGTRFHFYKGLGSRLERAIINFYLDTHTEHGYTEVFPPYMVNRASMTGTGQLPKFEEDAFHLSNEDYFLIPTAEVPVTNMYRDDIITEELPLKFCAYSACFRAEAGSAGRDTRGLIRQHQFNKVELVKFADPETSYDELESLTNDAERVLAALGLPYRVVCLSSGDLGFSSAKTYDIEVWMPSYNRYVEISSCSNFEDFQARRAAIRFKKAQGDKAQLVHTLNGSGVAVGRTVAAILENYQNADGTVTVPEVLRKYMGTDKIG
ncbi:MAG: serine--tRNA ligase [Ruminococcaceae bacterium]|nr:serine--tRNA ligase [Oscillospiraceae bacterium]